MNTSERAQPLFGSTGGSHPLARFTDQRETYGPLVVEQLVRNLSHLKVVIDLGSERDGISKLSDDFIRRLNLLPWKVERQTHMLCREGQRFTCPATERGQKGSPLGSRSSEFY
jgi:hypothetical protein